jgi:hypothetical protein
VADGYDMWANLVGESIELSGWDIFFLAWKTSLGSWIDKVKIVLCANLRDSFFEFSPWEGENPPPEFQDSI